MRSSGRNSPCPICDRVRDGDYRWNDDRLVLCHTIRGAVVAPGKSHPDRPYIYCGESDEAQGFGKWLPKHLAEGKPKKLKRERKDELEPILNGQQRGLLLPIRRCSCIVNGDLAC